MKFFTITKIIAFLFSLIINISATAVVPEAPFESNPIISIQCELGEIEIEVYLKKAPITASNFLKHIRNSVFQRSTIYRTVKPGNQPDNPVKIEVIQGGPDESFLRDKLGIRDHGKTGIPHETTAVTGIRHLDGTLSMARMEPGTADYHYFICINDQPSLDFGGKRNPDGQGFSAFGRVVKGMDIVRKIQLAPSRKQSLVPPIKVRNIVIK